MFIEHSDHKTILASCSFFDLLMDIILSFSPGDNKKNLEMIRDEKRIKTLLPKSCDFDSAEGHFGKILP